MKENITTISIAQTLAPIVSTRDAIVELHQKIEQQEPAKVMLDFSHVQFISRSAAHELLVLKEYLANRQPKIEVEFTNPSDSVSKMLRVVAANRAVPKEAIHEKDIPVVSIENLTNHKPPLLGFWRRLFAQ